MSAAAAAADGASPPTQSISLDDLPLAQLQNIKQQLEAEIGEMTSAYAQMKRAQAAFRECKGCLGAMEPAADTDKTIMIPLTDSLYVPGKLSSIDTVLVDVGTGYYVEKAPKDAEAYYDGKIEYVEKNVKKIQETIEQKQASHRGLLEVMQHKITQQQMQEQQG
ncbi:subunit of tubulin prefoldin, partial [Coemansia sp. RSA 552]